MGAVSLPPFPPHKNRLWSAPFWRAAEPPPEFFDPGKPLPDPLDRSGLGVAIGLACNGPLSPAISAVTMRPIDTRVIL